MICGLAETGEMQERNRFRRQPIRDADHTHGRSRSKERGPKRFPDKSPPTGVPEPEPTQEPGAGERSSRISEAPLLRACGRRLKTRWPRLVRVGACGRAGLGRTAGVGHGLGTSATDGRSGRPLGATTASRETGSWSALLSFLLPPRRRVILMYAIANGIAASEIRTRGRNNEKPLNFGRAEFSAISLTHIASIRRTISIVPSNCLSLSPTPFRYFVQHLVDVRNIERPNSRF